MDPFQRMAAAARPSDDPGLIARIGEETDRAAMIRIRRHAISADAHRAWVQLLNRRIADLTRDDAPTDFTKLTEQLEDRL